MSGEVLLFPGLLHRPDDITDAENILGGAARFTRKGDPPRARLVAKQTPKSQISPGAIVPARSSWRTPAATMPGGRPTPHGRRGFFPHHHPHHSPRRTR